MRRFWKSNLWVALALLSAHGAPVYSWQDRDPGKLYEQMPEKMTIQTPEAIQEGSKSEADPAKERAKRYAKAPKTSWIWGNDTDGTYRLSTSFQVKQGAKGWLRASCDNVCSIEINGRRVAASTEWQAPIEVDVTAALVAGENRVTAEVSNEGSASGFVLQLMVEQGDSRSYVVTSDAWKAAEVGSREEKPAKIVATYGDGPWGSVFDNPDYGNSSAGGFNALPGFAIEKLFTVPKAELGSWVCMTVDPKGRLIVSDQENQGLCRITPAPLDGSRPTQVERLDVPVSAAQGMLFAFDSLYLSINGGPGSGLYRLRDTNGDDQFDDVKKLREFRGGGEHGPHALKLSPDGKSIYVLCGNHTLPPFDIDQMKDEPKYRSRISTRWSEDHLLPRMWDANGHAVGILAPGGWVASTDPNGESWEMFSIGYRNPYDMDFNRDGELFVYDADMEWDMGMPWYRPTRVVHATSGSEFGWRSGSGKWPTYYADSLPPLIDIGPGSPVGVSFGYGAKFPKRYQEALFICDWTFGTMYAIHPAADGSTYRASGEEFLSRTPLPLTDVVIGADGAMYFTVGGRGTQSELYRVTYVGDSAASEPKVASDPKADELHKLRRKIETYHAMDDSQLDKIASSEIDLLIANLDHPDRFIGYAARVALEKIAESRWASAVLSAKSPRQVIRGIVGLARTSAMESDLLASALANLPYSTLSEEVQMEWHRALQLVLIRRGLPSSETQDKLIAQLESLYDESWKSAAAAKTTGQTPSQKKGSAVDGEGIDENASNSILQFPGYALNLEPTHFQRELITELIYLGSKKVVATTVAQMKGESVSGFDASEKVLARNRGYGGSILEVLRNQPNQQEIHFAFMLRNAKVGWTPESKVRYFEWFRKAHEWRGGASYQKFLDNMANESFENSSDVERVAVESAGLRQAYQLPELPKAIGPGKAWSTEEILSMVGDRLHGRNFENGARAYAAARCVVCHRVAGQGGSTGPDLTQAAGRFSTKDLLEAIVEPSKVVSDQYRVTQISTEGGDVVAGRVLLEDKQRLVLLTDPEDSRKTKEVAIEEIASRKLSEVSVMPKELLNGLNRDEVLDLIAYLLSRGDRNHAMFR